LLAANAAKSAREQLTLIRIFEELRGRGYDGGYDAVRRYARRWSKERGQSTAAAYVPLSFAPEEAYQFDWSHEVVLLNGVTVIVKPPMSVSATAACSLFGLIRARYRRWCSTPTTGRSRCSRVPCGRGIYDNMKTAVETIFVGKGRLCRHHQSRLRRMAQRVRRRQDDHRASRALTHHCDIVDTGNDS
jgi:hypothetical protein